jgi:hypothetical protein
LNYLGTAASEHFVLDAKGVRVLRLEPKQAPTEEFVPTPYLPISVGEIFESEHADPMRPEFRLCDMLTTSASKLKKRRIRRSMKRLVAPAHYPPLLVTGPSVSYSRLQGDIPSIGILPLAKTSAIRLDARDGRPHLHVEWQHAHHSIPLTEEMSARVGPIEDAQVLHPKELKAILGFKPHFVLLGFALPQDGYCRKVVIALLP